MKNWLGTGGWRLEVGTMLRSLPLIFNDARVGRRAMRLLPPASSLRPPAIAALAAIALSGCAIEPWVKPYERAALADPIMMPARDPVANEYLHHVHEVREGARGAVGSAGGGCGCN